MVQIIKEDELKNGSRTKMQILAWALNICILIISGLIGFGVVNLTSQFTTLSNKVEKIAEANHQQDLCIKELQINQQDRLDRERRQRGG